ncbi:MAG: AhpA/YtjB family protein [Aestuariibacter sp.]
MQTTSLLDIIAGEQSPGKVYRRLVYLALVLVVVTTLATLFINTNQSINQTLSSFSKGLGRDIAQQYSALLADSVATKNPEQATLFMQSLVQQSHILSAKVFDKYGQAFVAEPQQQDLVALHQSPQSRQKLTFIQPVNHDGNHVGYLRIIFDHGKIEEHQRQLNSVYVLQTQLLMVLSALITGLVIRKFYVWRLRRFYVRKKHKNML